MKIIYSLILIFYSCNTTSINNQALNFCIQNKLNTDFYILIDMSEHSGKERLFVYDFKTDSILISGLCSHGCGKSFWGNDLTKNSPSFSNTPDSHLSSLGKYRIGNRGYSSWGIHINYRIHGLEKTNNNAFKRDIVLHSWKKVSDNETFPKGTPEGWGCPAVSNKTMEKIDKFLRYSQKPVLLWIKNEKISKT